MSEKGSAVLAGLLILVASATAILVLDEGNPGRSRKDDFQRLLAGLGFGPALELSPCAFGFDPRLDDSCALDTGRIPGASCFCPRHAGSLLEYRRADGLPD